MNKQLTYQDFKHICPFLKRSPNYCDHKGNQDRAGHYSFKKRCMENVCPYRNEFKVTTNKTKHLNTTTNTTIYGKQNKTRDNLPHLRIILENQKHKEIHNLSKLFSKSGEQTI